MIHFALKGHSDALLTCRGENKGFSPPSPPCNVVPLFELPIENNKHPDFERKEGGVWILFFPVVTLYEYNVSTVLSLNVGIRDNVRMSVGLESNIGCRL